MTKRLCGLAGVWRSSSVRAQINDCVGSDFEARACYRG